MSVLHSHDKREAKEIQCSEEWMRCKQTHIVLVKILHFHALDRVVGKYSRWEENVCEGRRWTDQKQMGDG